jgi:hypothetical protein
MKRIRIASGFALSLVITGIAGRLVAVWDGVVIEGRADKPVWINIVNDKVAIENARALWGLNTYETQDRITAMVGGRTRFGEE